MGLLLGKAEGAAIRRGLFVSCDASKRIAVDHVTTDVRSEALGNIVCIAKGSGTVD